MRAVILRLLSCIRPTLFLSCTPSLIRHGFAVPPSPRGKAFFSLKGEIGQHNDTQHDAVDTEGREGMLSHILHQATDHQKADDEGHDAAHHQHADFRTRGADTGEYKFQPLDGRGAQHGGDRHEEGELRAGTAADTDENGAQNGRAGPGSAGDQAQTLEASDHQSRLIGDVVDILHKPQMLALIPPLHQNEGNAIDNKGDGHHDAVVQVGVHPVVEQDAHNTGRDDGSYHFEPQVPGLLLLRCRLAGGEGVQLMEEQDDHRQDGTQLDHHIEHAAKFLGDVQFDKFIQ